MKEQLHRVEPGTGGITRKGAGRGFSYVSANGRRITSDKLLKRIADLAVPPAWQHVWIASDPRAHIQATGVDAAGRTQTLSWLFPNVPGLGQLDSYIVSIRALEKRIGQQAVGITLPYALKTRVATRSWPLPKNCQPG